VLVGQTLLISGEIALHKSKELTQLPSQHLIWSALQVLMDEQRILDLAQAPFGQTIKPSGHSLSIEALQ
jgi:hypothetical protein